VDDDEAIVRLFEKVLRQEDFDVLVASGCADALAKLDEINGDVQVMVVDIALRDGDGPDLVRDASAKYGVRPTLYVSGWTEEFWSFHDIPGQWLVLRKPVSPRRIVAAVRWLAEGGPKPVELTASE